LINISKIKLDKFDQDHYLVFEKYFIKGELMVLYILVSNCPVIRQMTLHTTSQKAEALKALIDEDGCNAGKHCLGSRFHTVRKVDVPRKKFDAYVAKNGVGLDTDAPFIKDGFRSLFPPAICDRVKKFRAASNLTQREFAEIVGVYPESVSYFERYKWEKISPAQSSKILDFFECTYHIIRTSHGNYIILEHDGMDIAEMEKENHTIGDGDE
jgi:DNA-binding XRE family transcriptional regulator